MKRKWMKPRPKLNSQSGTTPSRKVCSAAAGNRLLGCKLRKQPVNANGERTVAANIDHQRFGMIDWLVIAVGV